MKCIRQGVFETNSSSSHAVSIKSGSFQSDTWPLRPDDDGVVRIYPGEFGWDIDIHRDAATKASYLMVWAQQYCPQGKVDEMLEMLREVIADETGAKEVRFCKSSSSFEEGYIDHQSVENGWDSPGGEVFSGGAEYVRAFIFNRKSMLVIDHDNH